VNQQERDEMSDGAARCSVVYVTTGTEDEARAIAHTLVQEQLAACVNFYPIQSVYIWQGEPHQDAEWQLVIKTQLALFDTLAARVQALHSYEVPEIIALPLQAGAPTYLAWIAAQTSSNERSSSERDP